MFLRLDDFVLSLNILADNDKTWLLYCYHQNACADCEGKITDNYTKQDLTTGS
jgi:hypothetical protein